MTGFAQGQLRSVIERIERLEEEKKVLASDISEVYAEAKNNGFDVRRLREIIRERRIDANDLLERNAILDIYRAALGHLEGTPLGQAAITRLHEEVSRAGA